MYGIRFPSELVKRIKALAEAEHRSFNAQVIPMLLTYVEQVRS